MKRLHLLILNTSGSAIQIWMEGGQRAWSLPCLNQEKKAPHSIRPKLCRFIRQTFGESAICGYIHALNPTESIVEVDLRENPQTGNGRWYKWEEIHGYGPWGLQKIDLSLRVKEFKNLRKRLHEALCHCFPMGYTSVQQMGHSRNSCVFQIQTNEGRFWLKLHYEAQREMNPQTRLPYLKGRVAPILQHDPQGYWSCNYDLGTSLKRDMLTITKVHSLVLDWADCQIASMRYLNQSLWCLPLRNKQWFLKGTRKLRSPEFRQEGLEFMLKACEEALELLEAVHMPLTLVHGDFHPGNVCMTPDGFGYLDFDFAGISYPLLDVYGFETSSAFTSQETLRQYFERFSPWVSVSALAKIWPRVYMLGILYQILHIMECGRSRHSHHQRFMLAGLLELLLSQKNKIKTGDRLGR